MGPFLQLFLVSVGIFICTSLQAEYGNSSAGRGGAFLEVHSANLSVLDPATSGNPLVFGGEGYTYLARNFRLGGAGGAAFLMNGNNSTHLGMGYGGISGQLVLAPGVGLGLMIGGGAYSLSTATTISNTTSTITTLSGDGFLLIQPDITFEAPISNWFKIGASFSAFLPNISKLQSLDFGLHFIFGRSD